MCRPVVGRSGLFSPGLLDPDLFFDARDDLGGGLAALDCVLNLTWVDLVSRGPVEALGARVGWVVAHFQTVEADRTPRNGLRMNSGGLEGGQDSYLP